MRRSLLTFLILPLWPFYLFGESFFKGQGVGTESGFFKPKSRDADVKRNEDLWQDDLRHKQNVTDFTSSSIAELEKKEDSFSSPFKSCSGDCFFLKNEKEEKDYEEVIKTVQNDVLSFKQAETSPLFKNKVSLAQTKPAFYIFVSFALHKNAIKELLVQAKRFGGTLVIRGLKDGSWKQTIVALQNESILLDPNLFKEYEITHVPTFVLTSESFISSSPSKKTFDKVSGLITVSHALRLFREKGDCSVDAEFFLRRSA